MKERAIPRSSLGGEGSKQFEFAKYFRESNAMKKSETIHQCVSASCFIQKEADSGLERMTIQLNHPKLGSSERLGEESAFYAIPGTLSLGDLLPCASFLLLFLSESAQFSLPKLH